MAENENVSFANIEAETDFEVHLYIYDMTKGLAKMFSAALIGKQLSGIWHTGIVAYGREYFFGSSGIESCHPGGTVLGEPDQILPLGKTQIPYSLFLEFVFAIGESTYRPGSYSLFHHNCNNFSQDVSQFLLGESIPKEIVDLPQEVLNTPLGQTLQPYFESLNLRAEGSRGLGFGTAVLDHDRHSNHIMSEGTENPLITPDGEETVKGHDASTDGDDGLSTTYVPIRKTRRYEDPPIVFKDADGVAALKALIEKMENQLNEEERNALKEINDYLTTDCGAWALGAVHLDLIGRLLNDCNFPPEIHILMLLVLQTAALKDDLILILHQDRKDHHVMSYIYRIESLTLEEQEEAVKLMCNFCENPSSFDWLMYISEWKEEGQACNNSKVTIRAAVHSILSERPQTQQKGVALMFNLALKELFDDTASELSTAVLQYLHGDIPEESAFYCLTAVLRFMSLSYNEVPALVKMLGPDMQKFVGKSQRVDELVEQIQTKLAVSNLT